MDVCVCVYSVFVLCCVQAAALRRTDHPSKESYRLCKNDYETEEEAKAQKMTHINWRGQKILRKSFILTFIFKSEFQIYFFAKLSAYMWRHVLKWHDIKNTSRLITYSQ
jgi:hypothetical protein